VPDAQQGEIWTVDLGMAAKVRPCLLLTDFPEDDELALIAAGLGGNSPFSVSTVLRQAHG